MLSKIVSRINVFIQRKPLLLNTVMYGSFFTAAEFSRQSYERIFETKQAIPLNIETPNHTEFVGLNENKFFIWMRKFNEILGLLDKQPPTEITEYNWAQLKRYAIYGCFLAGPLLYRWYKWLDSFYKGTSMKIVLVKLTVDQFVLTPVLIVIFFTSMSLMESKSNIFMELRMKFLKTFQTSCMFWLPVQFVNFIFIPSNLRVSYVSIAAFCWMIILCYLKSTPLSECEENEEKLNKIK